jgi:hypothetical protein
VQPPNVLVPMVTIMIQAQIHAHSVNTIVHTKFIQFAQNVWVMIRNLEIFHSVTVKKDIFLKVELA